MAIKRAKRAKAGKAAKAAKIRRLPVDLDAVRAAATGRWLEILQSVASIPLGILDGNHHPCPRCGGTDRFRLLDREMGAVFCNQCFSSRNGDGFAAIQWMVGLDFYDAAMRVAEYLGVDAKPPGKNGSGKSGSSKPAPDANLDFKAWNRVIAGLWCLQKRPITVAATEAAGCRLARYRNQFTVLAVPVIGQTLDKERPSGWAIYNTTGGPLPKMGPDGQVAWITKPKLTYGSGRGIIGDLERIKAAKVLWKLEGISDLLAWYSLPGTPEDHAAFTNANGCSERPATWMVDLCKDKKVFVLHDADVPGQRGAIGWTENGRRRPGWCEELASSATECRNVVLPYPVEESHGKDLRDWIAEGGTFEALRDLAASAQEVDAGQVEAPKCNDDPHRLARLNLERYATAHGGRTLLYWRDRWFVWKGKRYQELGENELRAKLTRFIESEFDRIAIAEVERYNQRLESGDASADERPPVAQKVLPSIVSSVVNATRSIVCISGDIELNSWIPDRRKKNYVCMANGILDVDAHLADQENVLLPHSPDWFSTVHLPYEYDPNAKCPTWEAFLRKNLEGDVERINLLQEWCGYLLTPDTGQQAFMMLEGEGANGKSVFCAGVEAMLGEDNCSHVNLESFGDRFSKTITLGKLVNICGDVGELDKVAEGQVKAFVSGNTMMFDRKGIDGITAIPTARLMLACNNRPRFSDKSSGTWRRMKIVPWLIQIQPHERIYNMDKAWWWYKTGEVPGIFNWALVGLYRLREQGGFTDSKLMDEAIKEYVLEANPARSFLADHMEVSTTRCPIKTRFVYGKYKEWVKDCGHMPLSESQFGKEVKRQFPMSKKVRRGVRTNRCWGYEGIDVIDGAFKAEDLLSAYTDENF